LITLGSAPLEVSDFRGVVLGQLGESRLVAAIDADISSPNSHARALDADTKGALREIHQRVGTTILFESSGGQVDKVAHLPELRFALGEPELDTTTIDNGAMALESKAFFIRRVGSDGFQIRYQPTLKKVVNDRRASLDEENEIIPEMRKLGRKEFERGAGIPVVYWRIQEWCIKKGNPMTRRPRIASKGTCTLCKSTFDKSGMTKHLQSCMGKSQIDIDDESKKESSLPLKFFHFIVEGHGLPEYWIHLKVSSHARFGDLDSFLREIWLECCNHMSAFSIGRDEISMNKKFTHILRPGMELHYKYDFGSTTELILKVVSEFKSNIKTGEVEILARNDPLQIKCSHCDNLATCICPECIYNDGGWLCDDCAEDHKCGEDILLPVVNSPRTGVCGYVG
jgi:hypothetical protein